MKDIRGLTLKQPWATAITQLGKDVENRTWKPSGTFAGSFLAIHAGKGWDETGATFIYNLTGTMLGRDACPAGSIIGVARVARFVATSESPWFFGPIGWELTDVVTIEPIPMIGAQGLWRVPDTVRTIIRGR